MQVSFNILMDNKIKRPTVLICFGHSMINQHPNYLIVHNHGMPCDLHFYEFITHISAQWIAFALNCTIETWCEWSKQLKCCSKISIHIENYFFKSGTIIVNLSTCHAFIYYILMRQLYRFMTNLSNVLSFSHLIC